VSVYDKADFLISTQTRHDNEASAGLTLGKRINDTVSATIGYQYRDVDSNIENYSYDNHRFLAAITARF
jgi:outer membrane protein assembly factor BamA